MLFIGENSKMHFHYSIGRGENRAMLGSHGLCCMTIYKPNLWEGEETLGADLELEVFIITQLEKLALYTKNGRLHFAKAQ